MGCCIRCSNEKSHSLIYYFLKRYLLLRLTLLLHSLMTLSSRSYWLIWGNYLSFLFLPWRIQNISYFLIIFSVLFSVPLTKFFLRKNIAFKMNWGSSVFACFNSSISAVFDRNLIRGCRRSFIFHISCFVGDVWPGVWTEASRLISQ